MTSRTTANIARVCYAIVFGWNVLCAFQFAFAPEAFAGAYQLEGVAAETAVRGIGVAFLMWNATYPAFLVSPERFKALGVVILVQQVIGLVGEVLIWCSLPQGYELLASSIMRFVAFDGAGLILMGISYAFFFSSLRRASA
ncbi:MAG: hypothetical protein HFJ65_00910 [Eggerthellaceae bacterium]|nr:hypothetical protein [Eggerthellaceae bacterium]